MRAPKKQYSPVRVKALGSLGRLTAGTGSMNGDAGQNMMVPNNP